MISSLVDAVDAALTVLTHRLLTLIAMVMAFGLFCWALYAATWIHAAAAAGFAVIVFLPVLSRDQRPEAKWKQDPQKVE